MLVMNKRRTRLVLALLIIRVLFYVILSLMCCFRYETFEKIRCRYLNYVDCKIIG